MVLAGLVAAVLGGCAGTHPIPFTLGSVRSLDGTTIGYRQLGSGPALIVLHGTAESSLSHAELAETLSDSFTVFLPDRRGRGLSGPSTGEDVTRHEVEDLAALLHISGAHFVMGVSSGAVVLLQAMLAEPSIQRAVVFEPPIPVGGSISTAFLPRYVQELEQGDTSAALVTGMLGAQMGPPAMAMLPRWVLEPVTTVMLAVEDRRASPQDVTLRKLAPTLGRDFNIAVESEAALPSFGRIQADVLLMGTQDSPAYFGVALDALAKTLPAAKRVRLPGVGHGASGNRDRRGDPDLVAAELRKFFGAAR